MSYLISSAQVIQGRSDTVTVIGTGSQQLPGVMGRPTTNDRILGELGTRDLVPYPALGMGGLSLILSPQWLMKNFSHIHTQII
jgi:hypothetical protein